VVAPPTPAAETQLAAPSPSRTSSVLVSGHQLDFVRAKIETGEQPWAERLPVAIMAQPKTTPGSGLDTRAKIVKYWQGQGTFVYGLTQETCRDFTHTGYGLAAIANFTETARIQGQSLYPEIADRLQALGFQTKSELGEAPPSWLCEARSTAASVP
jgi:hypothetical protein